MDLVEGLHILFVGERVGIPPNFTSMYETFPPLIVNIDV